MFRDATGDDHPSGLQAKFAAVRVLIGMQWEVVSWQGGDNDAVS
jgi:hypothetical protein